MTNPAAGRSGRVAIVAGASRGTGRATVHRLAKSGYAVVVNYAHDQRLADSTVDSILADNGAAVAVRADVADELDVERLFAETLAVFGRIDAVVHAVVGDLPTGPISEVTLEQFDALCRINTRGTFLINREAARFVRNGGAIVNLSSPLISRTLPSHGAHTASRAAVEVLTQVLALELVDRDISVNAVRLSIDGRCVPSWIPEVVAYLLSDGGHGVTGRVISIEQRRWDLDSRHNGGDPGR